MSPTIVYDVLMFGRLTAHDKLVGTYTDRDEANARAAEIGDPPAPYLWVSVLGRPADDEPTRGEEPSCLPPECPQQGDAVSENHQADERIRTADPFITRESHRATGDAEQVNLGPAASVETAAATGLSEHPAPRTPPHLGPACNACGSPMALADDAVTPLWRCACGREVPRWPGDTGERTLRAEEVVELLDDLQSVYRPAGVGIWLTSSLRSLGGTSPAEAIRAGRFNDVRAQAKRLVEGAFS